MARIEGTATAISAARSGTESLRTTIPVWVVEHLELTKDDRLNWKLDKNGDVWMTRVRKGRRKSLIREPDRTFGTRRARPKPRPSKQ